VNSTRALERHTHAVPRWSLNAALAGLPLALIAVGPAIVAGIGGRTLPVYASQLAIAVLVIHIWFTVLANHSYGGVPVMMQWLLAAAALLAVPLIWTNDPAGVLAYMNFASGTIGAIAIAQVWKCMPRGYSWIDVGYLVFLVGGMVQLLVSLRSAGSLNSLHQSSETPWGNSNFVAGCLVVAALIVMARAATMGRHRKYLITVGLAAIGCALLTLSRAAIVAACIGAVFFLWSKSGQRGPRRLRSPVSASTRVDHSVILLLLSRVLSVLIPVFAFIALDRATELRAQLNDRVYANIDVRVALYQLAWEEFLKHPLTGTGWASFREPSLDTVGESQTFAHNLVLSMLQIGGMLSLPYIVALAVLIYRALRLGGPYRAAIAASLAVSMTQPFFESTVGTLIVLPVAILAGTFAAKEAAEGGGGIALPPKGSARTRPWSTRNSAPVSVSRPTNLAGMCRSPSSSASRRAHATHRR
jgi:hypothetical protein